jgi:hypothetical protein
MVFPPLVWDLNRYWKTPNYDEKYTSSFPHVSQRVCFFVMANRRGLVLSLSLSLQRGGRPCHGPHLERWWPQHGWPPWCEHERCLQRCPNIRCLQRCPNIWCLQDVQTFNIFTQKHHRCLQRCPPLRHRWAPLSNGVNFFIYFHHHLITKDNCDDLDYHH